MGLSLCWTTVNQQYGTNENTLTNHTAAEQQLALVEQLRLNLSKRYSAEFDQRPFTRLPDLVVWGRKKCGTKTLLAFLLQHPRIHGNRQEYHWRENLGSFRNDMKAFMGRFSHTNLKLEPNQTFAAKIGMPSVIQMVKNKNQLTDFDAMNSTYLNQWSEKTIVIDCLCDPVRRIYSDFLHVRAEHNLNNPNSLLLGPNSSVYPFQNMTFDRMVEQYLSLYSQMKPDDKVRRLFDRGLYSDGIAIGRELFGRRLIVVDAEKFKSEPWSVLNSIERLLNIDKDDKGDFFTRERFVKREDGFYVRMRIYVDVK